MELILQAVSEIQQGRPVQDGSGRQGTQQLLPENRPVRQHVREFREKLLEPAQRPDPFRHPLRQGGYAGQPGSEAGHRRPRRRKADKSRGRLPQKNTKSFHATRKTKVSTIKIKKKWQRKILNWKKHMTYWIN